MVNHILTASSLLAAIFSLFIALLVYTRNHKTELSRIFILLSLSMAFWGFLQYQMRLADTYELAAFWDKFNVLWPFSMVLLFHFILVFSKQRWLLERKLTLVALYSSAMFFSLIDLTTNQITSDPVLEYWGWSSTASPPETLINNLKYIWLVILGLAGLYFVLRFYLERDDPIEKKQAGLVSIGVFIPLGLGLFGEIIFPILGHKVPELTDVEFAFGTGGFIGYAIWRYELFSLTPADAADKIIGTMSDCLLLVDPQGKIITTNQTTLDLLGYQDQELTGHPVEVVFAEDQPKGAIHEKEDTDSAYQVFSDIESSLRTKDQKRIPISLSSSVLHDKFGRNLGLILIARDITDRKITEKQLSLQSEKLKSANEELLVLHSFATAISQTLDLSELIERALSTIFGMKQFNLQAKGGVLLVEGDRLHSVVDLGNDDVFLKRHQDISIDDCLCGLAARTGQMVVTDDAFGDPLHTIESPGLQNHGHVIVPLKVAQKVIGVMYLYLPTGVEIDETLRHLLTTMGNQLAISIDNAMLYEETKKLSLHDPLTGLANRHLMNIELDKEFARAKRTGGPLSLIILDIDHFKIFNDNYGHLKGDELLVNLASILSKAVREVDLAARYGGEEFLLILSDTDVESARKIAERIRMAVESETFLPTSGFQQVNITVSLGISLYDSTVASTDELVSMADKALFSAKRKGRNRVEVYKKSGPSFIND